MSVIELSVQLKNSPGQIVQITTILAEANINIRAVAASSAGKTGWVRLVVDNSKIAAEALETCGFAVDVAEALAVGLSNAPGALDEALRLLSDAKINVDYIYTSSGDCTEKQLMVIGVQTPGRAEKLLKAAGVEVAAIDS
jgi:hypothetical protein